MESKTSRYQSRILREMHQNKENPFNSPPSSTGSHGTVTLTSDISYSPEGESTRRMGRDDSIMLPGLSNKHAVQRAPDTPFKVNTSAIGRDFPEYRGWDGEDHTDDIYNVTGDYEKHERKENIPPSSSTVNSPSQIEARKASFGTAGTRAHMQARVDDDSDHSGSIHSAMSAGSASRRRAAFKPQRGNVTALIQTLKAAQSAQDSTPKKSSPQAKGSERRSSNHRPSRLSEIQSSPATFNQTARSFFLPNLEHVNDLVSGNLKLTSAKNGIPVFVKHGKVHDRESKVSPDLHAELDAIEVPQDEQEIFVSLEKIREEIHALQAHDDQVSRQAEQLQDELDAVRNSGTMGTAVNSEELQSLRQDNIALRSQYKSMLEENRSLRSHNATITQQQSREDDNITLRSQYKSMVDENRSLRSQNASLSQQNRELLHDTKRLQRLLDAALEDCEILKKELDEITEHNHGLEVDHVSLERQNEKYYIENKSLQQKISLLERRVQDLQDNNEQLHDMIDAAVVSRETALAKLSKANTGKQSATQQDQHASKEAQNPPASASKGKPVKVTRILEPTTTRSRSTFSEVSAKSTTDQLGTQEREDFTRQFELTQDSDFDVLPGGEMDKMREALRQAKPDTQQSATEEYVVDEAEAGISPDDSQSLPPQFLAQAQRDTPSKVNAGPSKRVPSGILKNTNAYQRGTEQDLTGRFSVKSAMSGVSLPSQETRSDIFVNRRHSDSERFNVDVDENMTSELFMDDITLDSRKRAAQLEKNKQSAKVATDSRANKVAKKPIATLSTEAKRVLDGLCHDHDCRNCFVCRRINGHKHQGEYSQEVGKKTTITVERPVAVTDRVANPESTDADITMRPAQHPGVALATVLKGLQDELAHTKVAINRRNDQLNALDPSFARRERRQISTRLQQLIRYRDIKQDQIYRMHDVIEGQKQTGQQMTQAECDVTVHSIENMLGDETWDGILDDI
ncbi:hypothetical protein PFICI_06213 [Pestalotiopsis fici W106-1]|uniref:Cep57 centrosome microtubule-binding domain-containing protein n=1 Tax=Pestalotiopsis fici (strain W106-1 / CGMCC3.15140) TaxID=1229662 RepID=W3X7R4_PESFW|nr:uncharacterized protein PFICI_06213 [Pestalotiopsis fici W106-1]ETS81211.1 hypothetical protein PFICI_06213 [Pestalotiopsis fici W106-1]